MHQARQCARHVQPIPIRITHGCLIYLRFVPAAATRLAEECRRLQRPAPRRHRLSKCGHPPARPPRMDGRTDGWMDGHMDVNPGLRVARPSVRRQTSPCTPANQPTRPTHPVSAAASSVPPSGGSKAPSPSVNRKRRATCSATPHVTSVLGPSDRRERSRHARLFGVAVVAGEWNGFERLTSCS
jgi:hypothetical protein